MTESSPLFGIPSELRVHIFGYVLGGLQLHVTAGSILPDIRDKISVQVSICQLTRSEKSIAQDSKTEAMNADREVMVWNAHSACAKFGPLSQRLDLKLISTCRQIHAEAALLPLQLNTFILESAGILEPFLSELTVRQQAALQHIAIAGQNMLQWPSMGFHWPTRGVIGRLVGLQSLSIRASELESVDDHARRVVQLGDMHPQTQVGSLAKRYLSRVRHALKGLRLKSVEISFDVGQYDRGWISFPEATRRTREYAWETEAASASAIDDAPGGSTMSNERCGERERLRAERRARIEEHRREQVADYFGFPVERYEEFLPEHKIIDGLSA